MSHSTTLFGTDGIRAAAGEAPLDEPTVSALGYHLGTTLGAGATVVMGGDTRDSTPEIAGWLTRGLAAAGVATDWVGVVPTPAVACLVKARRAAAGVAVSASHNPWPDNGIKLFDAAGYKWRPEAENELERRLAGGAPELPRAPLPALDAEAGHLYLDALAASLEGHRPLQGLRVALDTAHGATSSWARPAFEAAGATVDQIGGEPDGRNINQGVGSTHPDALAARLAAGGFDLGVAFDGDGDRAILIDGDGRVRDGDEMLFVWALDLLDRGLLVPPKIAATSMSNLGLEEGLAARGVSVVRCDVGDRVVVATMREHGLALGGEQSGHVVCAHLTTTGDGMLTALQIAAVMARTGRSLAELLAGFHRFPQLLRNVRVARKPPFDTLAGVTAKAGEVESALAGHGRIVLRYSGTEPLARIMLEGPDQAALERWADELAGAIREEVGA